MRQGMEENPNYYPHKKETDMGTINAQPTTANC